MSGLLRLKTGGFVVFLSIFLFLSSGNGSKIHSGWQSRLQVMKNTKRAALVWLDEHLEDYYKKAWMLWWLDAGSFRDIIIHNLGIKHLADLDILRIMMIKHLYGLDQSWYWPSTKTRVVKCSGSSRGRNGWKPRIYAPVQLESWLRTEPPYCKKSGLEGDFLWFSYHCISGWWFGTFFFPIIYGIILPID